MSLHLMECVRPLRLTPSTKLALLAFADSADKDTRISFPGVDAVMEWAGVSRSRAFEILRELQDLGYLRQHYRGHNGRRSEYVVFPGGCCDLHPTPGGDDEEDQGPAHRTQPVDVGSGPPDSVSVQQSGPPDPTHDTTQGSVQPTGPNTREGSGKGPAHRTPSLSTTTSPPTPHASGAGGAGCARHKPPAPNCRGCGTTQRQLSEKAYADAADATRQAAIDSGARCPGGRPWDADGLCGCPPPTTHARAELVTAIP